MNSRAEYVLDSSALLAVLGLEPGHQRVKELMEHSAVSAVNLAEIDEQACTRNAFAGSRCKSFLRSWSSQLKIGPKTWPIGARSLPIQQIARALSRRPGLPHAGEATPRNRRHLRPRLAARSFPRRPYNDLSMRIGVFTALLSKLPLVQVLEKLQSLDIHTVELGTGNYPGDPHCPLSMLTDRQALREFKLKLEDRGFSISALSCHGNPLHPNPALAKAFQETSRKTVRLAEKLGVPVVIDFSGCPGDSNNAKYPNWITCPWPPEYLEASGLAMGEEGGALLDAARAIRQGPRRQNRHRDASRLRRL